ITRQTVIALAKKRGYKLIERTMKPEEMATAQECFITGTAAEVTPVREVDNRSIGHGKRGPITEKLQAAYLKLVKGESDTYADWLSHI
ncbi:MAG: aminotransferase class IV, partial [Stenotrophobium sp.]